MLAQQREDFACHVRAKVQDTLPAHRHPFAVRAGQHNRSFNPTQQLLGAKDLNFFASHHIRDATVLATQAGDDGDRRCDALGIDPLEFCT